MSRELVIDDILEKAKEIFPQMIQDRREIHKNPEIGFELENTTKYVINRLKSMGYEPVEISKSAVVATIGTGDKTILLRGDMDALPVSENIEHDFKSNNEYGHLCGHDIHTAMLLGVARLLKEQEKNLKGRVKLMFQPAEEIGLGAKSMVEAGVLDGVDVAMALHVSNDMEVCQISYVEGVCTSYADAFMIDIYGKGGHSSTPHLAIDPLIICNNIYMMLNSLVSKEVDPKETAVLTIGKMGGGTVANAIPDTAVIEGMLRTFNPDVRKHLVSRIYEIIEQTTKTLRGTYNLRCSISTPAVINDKNFCDTMGVFIKDIVGDGNLIIDNKPLSGTEDFSYISEKVPTMLAWIGAGGINQYPLHNPNVDLNEEVLPIGCAILTNCAINWLAI